MLGWVEEMQDWWGLSDFDSLCTDVLIDVVSHPEFTSWSPCVRGPELKALSVLTSLIQERWLSHEPIKKEQIHLVCVKWPTSRKCVLQGERESISFFSRLCAQIQSSTSLNRWVYTGDSGSASLSGYLLQEDSSSSVWERVYFIHVDMNNLFCRFCQGSVGKYRHGSTKRSIFENIR